MDTANTKHSKQVFSNPFIELLTKAAPQISVAVYFSVIGVFLYQAGQLELLNEGWVTASIFLFAIFVWTLFEYVFHRYVNHLDHYFPNSKTAARIAYTLHGIHHDFPRDEERLIMPPIPGLLIIGILFGLFYLMMGQWTFLFQAGFLTGYLIYVGIHYSTHKFKPPRLLRPLWRHHALHHQKYSDKAFGVSTTIWDRIFRSMPPRSTSQTKS